MSSPIDGTWYNSYQSNMQLQSFPGSGLIVGSYSSNTGASGTYDVLGWVEPGAAAPQPGGKGQAVALTLNWHSTTGTRDPSWNCVSGLCGQFMIDENGNQVLELVHQFVASNPVPLTDGLLQVGLNSDKLTYTRTKPQNAVAQETPCAVEPPAVASGAPRVWTCREDSSIHFTQEQSSSWGFVGDYTMNGQTHALVGQYNSEYQPAIGPYQSYAVTTLNSDLTTNQVMSVALAGWLDTTTDVMTVLEMRGVGTTWGNRYTSVRTRGLTFV